MIFFVFFLLNLDADERRDYRTFLIDLYNAYSGYCNVYDCRFINVKTPTVFTIVIFAILTRCFIYPPVVIVVIFTHVCIKTVNSSFNNLQTATYPDNSRKLQSMIKKKLIYDLYARYFKCNYVTNVNFFFFSFSFQVRNLCTNPLNSSTIEMKILSKSILVLQTKHTLHWAKPNEREKKKKKKKAMKIGCFVTNLRLSTWLTAR